MTKASLRPRKQRLESDKSWIVDYDCEPGRFRVIRSSDIRFRFLCSHCGFLVSYRVVVEWPSDNRIPVDGDVQMCQHLEAQAVVDECETDSQPNWIQIQFLGEKSVKPRELHDCYHLKIHAF